MLRELKKEANLALTENGGAAYLSSGSDCLDLFAAIGALRSAEEAEVAARFLRAYAENPDDAMKLLFFARDVRGGLGERRVFRVVLNWLSWHEPASLRKNLPFIGEYGRYDDLLCLLDTPCEPEAIGLIREQLHLDQEAMKRGESVSLLAKWLPSVNTSNAQAVRNAKRIARALNMTDALYRKTLSALRRYLRVLENDLRERDYSFDYEAIPSRALFKYRAAFSRNDPVRYHGFLQKVQEGKAVLHTGALMPYDLIVKALKREITPEERKSLSTCWAHLEDTTNGENALAVVDTSGSMYWELQQPLPASIAISLGLYFAERNRGAFHNHFISFSEHPRLIEIKGRDLVDKVRYISSQSEVANTDLSKVFQLLLDTAVKNHLPQSELPTRLYIISDMEFDDCAQGAGITNFAHARKQFSKHGYQLPQVVFWNVASRHRQQPVTKNEQGVALVSGFTPKLFCMIQGGDGTPEALMLQVLHSPRYEKISA